MCVMVQYLPFITYMYVSLIDLIQRPSAIKQLGASPDQLLPSSDTVPDW